MSKAPPEMSALFVLAARFFRVRVLRNRSPDKRSAIRGQHQSIKIDPECRCAHPGYEIKNKRKRNAGRRRGLMPARKRRAGRATEKGGLRRPPLAGALACRRSTAVFTNGTFVPRAQLRARLPERRHREADIAARAACSVTAKHLARRS